MLHSLESPTTARAAAGVYLYAKQAIERAGYGAECDEQWFVNASCISETHFLRETAWVVLCSGMREQVVRHVFGDLSTAFLEWVSASAICRGHVLCREQALKVFAHKSKIEAILSIAAFVKRHGVETISSKLKASGPRSLEVLPYIGPITSFHLAKNLGLQVAKPDRHLSRITSAMTYSSAQCMCEEIALVTGDPIALVDSVLWRFATLTRNYSCKIEELMLAELRTMATTA